MPSPALIHSDLSRTHVFVAPGPGGEMRLAGVIDLEFGRFADPLSEHLITGFEWGTPRSRCGPRSCTGTEWAGSPQNEAIRIRLYVALSLAWFVPLLAFQGQPFGDVMSDFDRVVDEVERSG